MVGPVVVVVVVVGWYELGPALEDSGNEGKGSVSPEVVGGPRRELRPDEAMSTVRRKRVSLRRIPSDIERVGGEKRKVEVVSGTSS